MNAMTISAAGGVGGVGGVGAGREDAMGAAGPVGRVDAPVAAAASLAAAAAILDWDELAPPTLEEMAAIIERHRAVSAEDVMGFVRGKLAELRAVCPGYVSFAVDGLQLDGGSPVVSRFRVYSAVTRSFEGTDPDELIRRLAGEARGGSEAELLRNQAAELLGRARLLEAGQSKQKKPFPTEGTA